MEFPKLDILNVIFQLMPGFLMAWIFYGLTAHPQKTPFERTVQALIFTGIIRATVDLLGSLFLWMGRNIVVLGTWNENNSFLVSMLVAVVFGFIFTGFANTNRFHAALPKWLSKRTSYPSEWFSAFNKQPHYVYLHLKDQRRIYGWPYEWPDSSETGHFVLVKPEWILEDNTRCKLLLTEKILIPVNQVLFVEFEIDEVDRDYDQEEFDKSVSKLIDIQNTSNLEIVPKKEPNENVSEPPNNFR